MARVRPMDTDKTRKTQRARLKALEEALRFERKPVVRFDVGLDRRIANADAGLARLTGRAVGRLNGSRLDRLVSTYREHLDLVFDHFLKGTPYPGPAKAFQVFELNGTGRYFRLFFRPRRDKRGTIRGFRVTGTEATREYLTRSLEWRHRVGYSVHETIDRLHLGLLRAFNVRGARFTASTLIGGINDRMARSLGYRVKDARADTYYAQPLLFPQPVTSLLTPTTVRALNRCLGRGTQDWIDGEIVTRGGSRQPARLSITRYVGQWGNASFHVLIVDRSEDEKVLRGLNERLVESEEKFRNLFENSCDPTLVVSTDGVIVDSNKNGCEFLGTGRDEMIGKSFWMFISKEGAPTVRSAQRKVEAEGHAFLETQARRRDGSIAEVEVSVSRTEVGGRCFDQVILHDVTARKRLEHEIRESEAKYRTLVENLNAGLIILQDERIRFANRKVEEIAAAPVEALLGQSFHELVSEEDRPRIRALYEAREAGKTVPNVVEARATRADGREIIVEAATSLVTFEGQPATQVVVRDVTEQKSLQHQLQRAERLASVGTLAAGVAHEINNPVAVISVDLLRLKRQHKDDAFVVELCTKLLRMTKRIFEITTGLLTFSKATGGMFGRYSLERALEVALDLVASRFDYEEKRLVEASRDKLPKIWCDRDRLEQVFVNVCINALEAMPKGGTLTVSARSEHEDGMVTLDFADTGKGMTAKEASRAFDPFYTTKDTGSGLGLAICHSIVEEHKGRVWLKSVPGKGTTVSVVLPVGKPK